MTVPDGGGELRPMSEALPIPPALLEAEPPGAVLEVLRTLAAAGHRSWIVGGAVRDLLLGRSRPGADLDVATPARPEEVFPLFRKVVATGVEHGTVTVVLRGQAVEVTTFRGEGAYLDGRRPSTVTFLDDIDADLARRDFTVNALAWDPLAPAFRDPFDGQADLRRRVLRAVGDPVARFAEDGLRPVRAARFAAQLGFALDPATAAAIPGALPVTARVSAERLSAELSRLLVAPHAREGLALLEESGLLALLSPELAALTPQARAHAFDVAVALAPELFDPPGGAAPRARRRAHARGRGGAGPGAAGGVARGGAHRGARRRAGRAPGLPARRGASPASRDPGRRPALAGTGSGGSWPLRR